MRINIQNNDKFKDKENDFLGLMRFFASWHYLHGKKHISK